MALRVTVKEAIMKGWINPEKKSDHSGLSSKAVNTGKGTPQHILYSAIKQQHPDIPLEWERKGLIPGRRFVIDLYIPPRLVIECDGYQFHFKRSSFQGDRKRQNLLIEHGFLVLRYFTKQILRVEQREEIISQIIRVHSMLNVAQRQSKHNN